MRGFFITATDTGVGKTLVTSILTLGLRQMGLNVCPLKPIGTGGIEQEGRYISEDAQVYRQLTGIEEPASVLNPICFRYPASPHLSSEMEEKAVRVIDVLRAIKQVGERYELLVVEGVGGWLVPIKKEYCIADFANELGLPVLVVSANRLGAINHTLLTLESIRARGSHPAGVIFTDPASKKDPAISRNNIETVQRLGRVEILGEIPFLGKDIERKGTAEKLWQHVKENVRWERIQQILYTAKTK